MGLGLAGMVSGLGQGLQQGLQTLNSGIVQMGVQSTLQGEEREFQMKKLQLQQQFEKGMQGEKIAADRRNTLDTIAAKGVEDRKIEELRGTTNKEIVGMQTGSAEKIHKDDRDSRHDLEIKKLAVTKDIHDKDRAVLEQHYKDYAAINKERLKAEKGEVTTFVTKEGKVALINKRDGSSKGYLLDSQGKEIIAQKDIPQSVVMEGNAIQHEIDNLTREYIKNPMRTEEQEDAHREAVKSLQRRYDQLIAPYRTDSATSASPPPKKLVIPEKYRNMGPAAKPGMVGPMKPSGMTQGGPGMMGTTKELHP